MLELNIEEGAAGRSQHAATVLLLAALLPALPSITEALADPSTIRLAGAAAQQLGWLDASGAPLDPPVTWKLLPSRGQHRMLGDLLVLDIYTSAGANYGTGIDGRAMMLRKAGFSPEGAQRVSELSDVVADAADEGGSPSAAGGGAAETGNPLLVRALATGLRALGRQLWKGAKYAAPVAGVVAADHLISNLTGRTIEAIAADAKADIAARAARYTTILDEWDSLADVLVSHVLPGRVRSAQQLAQGAAAIFTASESAVRDVLEGGSPDAFARSVEAEVGAPLSSLDDAHLVSLLENEVGCPCSDPTFFSRVVATGDTLAEAGSPAQAATYAALLREGGKGAKWVGFPSPTRFAQLNDRRQARIINRAQRALKAAGRRHEILAEIAQRPGLRWLINGVVTAAGAALAGYTGGASVAVAATALAAFNSAVNRAASPDKRESPAAAAAKAASSAGVAHLARAMNSALPARG